MWVDKKVRQPIFEGPYLVFGTINIDTEFETSCKFIAYWNGEKWRDKDMEDLTYINDGVKYWFDMSQLNNPI